MGPKQEAQSALFYDFSIEEHVPADHVPFASIWKRLMTQLLAQPARLRLSSSHIPIPRPNGVVRAVVLHILRILPTI